jgi:hypothetical protein
MVNRAWKSAALLLTVALIGSNGFWLYQAIDGALTRSYSAQIAQEREKQVAQLETIANHYVAGRPLSEVRPFIFSTATSDNTFHKPEERLWWVGNVALILRDEKTVGALTVSPYER